MPLEPGLPAEPYARAASGAPVERGQPARRPVGGRDALAGCPVCGRPLSSPGACPNRLCRSTERAFSVVFPVGSHRSALRGAIGRYKYRGERWWADVFAGMVAAHLQRNAGWFEEFDLIVPVPSYTGRAARRQWDPVGEICRKLGSLCRPGWDVEQGAIVKTRETPAMQGRGLSERRRIAAGPLRRALVVPDRRLVAGARILVLDDVMTAGGTLSEVAGALRSAGASEVAGIVLARPAPDG